MTIRNFYKVAIGILITLALAATAAVILIPRLLDLNAHRARILSMAQQALHRRVSYASASFSWNVIPSFDIRGITVAEKSGEAVFLKADRLTFRLAILPLLHKEVRLKDVVVERPELVLSRDREGAFSIDDLLKGKPSELSVYLRSVRIVNGLVRFTDRLVVPEGSNTSLENLDLYASRLARGKASEFRFSAMMPDGKVETAITASGTVRIPAEKESLNDTKFDVTLATKNFAPGRFWAYYGRYLPFEQVNGELDFEGRFKGKPKEFTTKGNLRLRDLRLNYPEVFHAVLTPKDIRLAYELECTPRDLSVKSFDLTVDGLHAAGSCALHDLDSDDPHIIARAVSSPFRLENFRQYIPYGIIVKSVADIIERHVMGGVYRLDEGSLDGRVSQILHMERGNNYNILHIRGRVDKGLVTLGPDVPTVNGINGAVELLGKDFIVRNITGNFGTSPFTLEGKVTDYPLTTPAGFPFTMVITPAKSEIAWLLRQDKGSDIAFSGRSLLQLSGSGSITDYRLSGSWDLTGADYRYRQLLHKPAGAANRLRFTARLGEKAAEVSEFQCELPPLRVSATATYRFNNQRPLTLDATTNTFSVAPLLPLVPGLLKYHPSGKLQARISGSGDPADLDGISFSGSVSLVEFAARPSKQIASLHGITGTIHLTESAMDADHLAGWVGNTAVTVSGHQAGYDIFNADLIVSSPVVHLDDLGYRSSEPMPEVTNLRGAVSLKENDLTVESLSGEANHTKFEISGEVADITAPQISLHADFPHLRVEDLAPFIHLKRTGESDEEPPDIALNARVTSREGSVRDITFKDLDTELSLASDRLHVHSIRVGVFGGIATGNGLADFSPGGSPLYKAHFRLDNIDAASLQRATDLKQYLTGTLTVEGNVTTRGNSLEELKRSAAISARLHLLNGDLIAPSSSVGGKERHIPYIVLDAAMSFKDSRLTVKELNAGIFGGTVVGSGEVDFTADGGPRYSARYRLEHLDLTLLVQLTDMRQKLVGALAGAGEVTMQGSSGEELLSAIRLSADVKITEGALIFPAGGELEMTHEFPFKKLQARFSFGRNRLDITSARIEAFGGVITGDAGADYGIPEGPGYRLKCVLENIDADDFLHAFDVTRDLSGRMNLQVDVTARGVGETALQSTLSGTVTAHLEKGIIRKYGFVSKIFSILNVSQLIDFRLPDVMTSGMPYDRIDGTYSIDNGKVTTKDLTMRSPSLNMTIVGEMDIVKTEIDLKVGVQAFQTVKRVVSSIPIAGWLLTGGKKGFLMVYYDVKGKWRDPKVSAIPQTSMSSGILNIFKRALALPDEMVTRPGKVFLGK